MLDCEWALTLITSLLSFHALAPASVL